MKRLLTGSTGNRMPKAFQALFSPRNLPPQLTLGASTFHTVQLLVFQHFSNHLKLLEHTHTSFPASYPLPSDVLLKGSQMGLGKLQLCRSTQASQCTSRLTKLHSLTRNGAAVYKDTFAHNLDTQHRYIPMASLISQYSSGICMLLLGVLFRQLPLNLLAKDSTTGHVSPFIVYIGKRTHETVWGN